MTKAEEKAIEYADKALEYTDAGLAASGYKRHNKMKVVNMCGYDVENAYLEGYDEGIKYASLTWEDIERLDALIYAIKNNKTGAFTFSKMPDEKYKEVLKRFNEQKKCEHQLPNMR